MKKVCLAAVVLCAAMVSAQDQKPQQGQLQRREPGSTDPAQVLTLPAGTKVPLILKHAISTKSARENDSVYAQTNFPVVINDRMAIPPGTYVQGVITRIQRPGKVKGRGELLVHFTSMIFPSGYTVLLPGAVDNVPGEEKTQIKGQEGTIQADGSKGHDAGTVAGTAATGTIIGATATRSMKGAGIGGLAGAAVGLGTVLLTRGPDVRLESGTTVEMVLEREITIDRAKAGLHRN